MQWIRFAVLILLVTLLQATVNNFSASRPDFLLILLVFFAIYSNTTDAIICSFIIGFAADIIVFPMGPQIISFGVLGTLLAYLNRVIAIRSISYQAAAIFVMSFLAGILTYLLVLIKGQPFPPNKYYILFWTSIYSSVLGPFFFSPTAWWMRIKTHRFSRH